MASKQTGADELRTIVRVLDGMREGFNDLYTTEQLVKLVRIHRLSEWDITPDQWTINQLNGALRQGIVPCWDENHVPTML